MEYSVKYWDKTADRLARQPIIDSSAYQFKLLKTQEYLTPESKVLEFGCGTGSVSIALSPFVNFIQALDISENMLDIAQRRSDNSGIRNINYAKSAVEEWQEAPASYDAVVSMNVLHLLKNRPLVLNKVYELLLPGGYFIVSCPCMKNTSPLGHYFSPLARWLGLAATTYAFTAKQLKQELLDAEFSVQFEWQPSKHQAHFFVLQKPAN